MTEHTTQIPLFPTEEWHDIPGYEGLYVVSNLGQVKRVAQRITTKHGHTQRHNAKDKVLGLKNGYYYLWLFKHNQGRKFYVHELVALAFIGQRPGNHQIHHRNENRLDNRHDNLEYLPTFAHQHMHKAGKVSGNTKLAQNDVDGIRILIKTRTMSQAAIARQYGVSPGLITMIKNGQRWNR